MALTDALNGLLLLLLQQPDPIQQAAPPPTIQAVPSASAAATSDSIIVTGERIDRRLRETPSSVSVFDQMALERFAGVDRLEGLLEHVPNVQIGSGGEGPTIRGQDSTGVLRDLPAFLGGTRPRATVQVDGRAIGYNEFVYGAAPLFDVRQVEVFRSPQTTTQGRNAIGGAIFLSTADPTFDWQARGRLIAGDPEAIQGSALLSGPIISDQLAFRAVADVRQARTISDHADFIPDADPNRDRSALFRLKLLAQPHFLPGARLLLTYSHVDTRSPQLEGVRPPFAARRDTQTSAVFATDVDAITARLDLQLSRALRLSTTISFGDASIQRLAQPGIGRTRIASTDISAEPILTWRPSAGLTVVAGLNQLNTHLTQFIDLSRSIGTGNFRDDQASTGLFANIDVTVSPLLTVTAGVRRQEDRQRRIGAIGNAARQLPLDYDRSFAAWLPKLVLTFAPADNFRIGAMVQRASNPGGVTIALDTGEADTFEAETLWSYELFARAALLNDRLTLSANLFYNDIANAQRPQVRTIVFSDGTGALATSIDNAPSAETYGLEAELSARIQRTVSLRLGVGLLGSRTLATRDPRDPILGREFQRSPHVSATLAVDWRPAERILLSVQVRHSSGYFSDDVNSADRAIAPYTVVSAQGSWRLGPVTLFAYARNLFDTFYLTYLLNPAFGTAGQPRQAGLGIDVAF